MNSEILLETEISGLRFSVIAGRVSFRLERHTDDRDLPLRGPMDLHQHSFYELFYVPHDSITIETENETVVYNEKAVVIPPRYNHFIKTFGHGYCFTFAIEGDLSVPQLSDGISAFDISSESEFYIDRLAFLIENGRIGEEAEHLCALFFISLFKGAILNEEKESSASMKYRNYVSILDTYISKHFSEQIRIDDVANELHLCSKQVSRIINKEYGMPLSRVVHRRRLSVACMLLKSTSLPISQISETVGYEYENYFFRMFKDTYGMTPAEYRELA